MNEKTKSKVGVVIVNYNSGECLEQCVLSVLKSNLAVDLVIVDNDSIDESLSPINLISTGCHRLVVIENDDNYGFSKAVNQGVLELETQYIMLLNPDSTVFPKTISTLLTVLSSDDQIAIAGAMVFNQDGSEQRGCRRNEPTLKRSIITALGLARRFEGVDKTYEHFPSQPVEVDAVSGAAMMIRRSHFDLVGGMDEDYFLHCEDLDICRRMRDKGYIVMFCPTASVFHRQGVSTRKSVSEVERYKHQGMLTYKRKHSDISSNRFSQVISFILVKFHLFLCLSVELFKKAIIRIVSVKQTNHYSHFDFSTLILTENTNPVVLITGGKSDVGDYLIRRLGESQYRCIAVSRNNHQRCDQVKNVYWLNLEFFIKSSGWEFDDIDIWINLAPIWTTPILAKIFHKFRLSKLIALSSTSIEGKAKSENMRDLEIVDKLKDGENWIKNYANKYDVDVSILRPTLIYGGPRNQNINFIEKMIRRCRFFPMIGDGAAKRQPVHAEDIAIACTVLLDRDKKSFDIYNLGGGEVLSYQDMVIKLFNKFGWRARFITVPVSLVAMMIKSVGWIPGFKFLTPEMASRMSQDLVYPIDKAKQEFSYNPRKFEP